MIKAIIFDKDGTLHDTEKVFAAAWRLAAEELCVPDIEATLCDCTGMTIPNIARYWAEKYPTIPFDEYLPRRQYHFNEIVKDGIPVKPGAYELLDYLTSHGYLVGMATSSGYEKVMNHLERTQMLRYFQPDAIITGDMVEEGKPDPHIFRLAAERLGTLPEHTLGVEDSNNGIRAIHAAGMRPILIPDTVTPRPEVRAMAWHTCESLVDIIPLLENEGK